MDWLDVVKFVLVIVLVVLVAVYVYRRQADAVAALVGDVKLPLNVRMLTWNLGDAAKKVRDWSEYLDKWEPITNRDYDVLCFTVQESRNSDALGRYVAKMLSPEYDWYSSMNYGPPNILRKPFAVQTHVYARRSLGRPTVRHDSITHQGIPVYMNTKSSSLLTLEFANARIVFVGSHLPIKTKAKDMGYSERAAAADVIAKRVSKERTLPTAVFWAGDLNFRKNTEADGIVRADQLTHWLANTNSGFQESTPDFAPTCKLMTGDVREPDKSRTPSHCDRVLYQELGLRITPGVYTSYRDGAGVSMSDHDPVVFNAQINTL